MRRLIAFIAAAALLLFATDGAFAAGGSTSFTTTAGTGLTVTGAAPGTLSAVTLNGQVQTQYTTLGSFTAADSTGTGSGWNITFQATQFKCTYSGNAGDKCPTAAQGGNSLPVGSLTMAPPTVACDAASSCGGQAATPTISISSNTGIDVASAVKVASAAANTGMGTYDFTPANVDATSGHNLKLVIPSWVYAGATYNSTLTVSIGTGP
jgi:hypothetical protein